MPILGVDLLIWKIVWTNIKEKVIKIGTKILSKSECQRRINEVIGITYDTSDEKITKAIEILKNILNNNEEITTNTVFLKQLNSSSIDIQIIAYIKYGDIDNFRRIRENIIIKILKEYKKEGIDFAFPSQTIYVNNEN